MRPPFPGMDPWLEHPAIWPDVHNSLIAAVRDAMAPLVAPRYYIGLESRTYLVEGGPLALVGIPDLAIRLRRPDAPPTGHRAQGGAAVLEVDLPMGEEARETFLEVREVGSGRLVTLVEVLSPANKVDPKGRRKYERKRVKVFESLTNLVEVDLLRAGRPMPVSGREPPPSDYRILVSPEPLRPKARLHAFDLRDPIPVVPLPLAPGDDPPPMDIGAILHALYDRVRFDLVLQYDRPPAPPLSEEDAAWAGRFTGLR